MSVSIPISREHEGLPFKDQILLTDEEFAALTPAQIEAMAEARFQNWRAVMTAVPEPEA